MDREVAEVPTLERPDEYTGQAAVHIAATQLPDSYTASERRKILQAWILFLGNTRTNIEHLHFVSRVPQDLLDAVAGQPQLRSIGLKWGPFHDLSPVIGLRQLERVTLGGATRIHDLAPLTALPRLSDLWVSQAHSFQNFPLLGELTSLRTLGFGNSSMGSDKNVVIPDLAWVASLSELTELDLPGTLILNPDLSPLLALPNLRSLELPLRRKYRKQVFEFAEHSALFADVAAKFTSYDAWAPAWRQRAASSDGRA